MDTELVAFGVTEQIEEPNIRRHCGDITTDDTCSHCGCWLIPVPKD